MVQPDDQPGANNLIGDFFNNIFGGAQSQSAVKQGGNAGAASPLLAQGNHRRNTTGYNLFNQNDQQTQKQHQRQQQPLLVEEYKPSLNFLRKFRGKNILVTGASGGIGTEVCLRLIKESDCQRLAMLCRDATSGQGSQIDPRIEQELSRRNDKHRFNIESCDFRQPQIIESMFSNLMKSFLFGHLDAIILCHGIVVQKGVIGCTIPDFDQTMLVNVRSMMHLMSLSLPFLKHQEGQSSITVLTSTQGLAPDPMSTVMSVSHSMLQQLVKCSALESAYHGVRVNAVAAGVTNTKARTKTSNSTAMQMSESENQTFLSMQAQDVPLNSQIAEPQEVAASLLFLASEDSSFTNGEVLVVDGGQSLTTNVYDEYVNFLQSEFK